MALSMMPTLTANAANNITLSVSSASTSSVYTTVDWTAQQYVVFPTATVISLSVDQSATIVASSTALASGTVSVAGSGTATVTLTVTGTTTAGAASYPIEITFPDSTPRNYSVSMRSSSPVDVGAALFYAYGGNQVTVTADVPSILSFAIRNDADSANTNVCALGTLGVGSEKTCVYRLRISTNAAGGFLTQIVANHDLNNVSSTIMQVADNAASTPGTEQYGIRLNGATAGGREGALYTGAVTEENVPNFTFQTDTSPVPTSTQDFISYADAFDGSPPFNSNTTRVTHFANISVGTPAGAYSQVVTYTVTGRF